MRIAAALMALLRRRSWRAAAATCGPDKLGTSRVVEVGTQGGLEVGFKTYPQTIPLADHEVILTFDDGPAAKTTPEILNALAEQCVRATFFEIGRNAEELPAIARREVLDGHTVAHHTCSHPQPTLRYMSDAAARADIAQGHDRGREGGLRAGLQRRRAEGPQGPQAACAVLPLSRLRRHRGPAPVARRQQRRHFRRRPLGVRLDQDDAGGGAQSGHEPARRAWARACCCCTTTINGPPTWFRCFCGN